MLRPWIESAHFLTERQKISKLRSTLLVSAIEMIESAYWLLAGDHFEHALVMFDNAIEQVLKGELERIHPILVVDSRNLADFEVLKNALKDSFQQHPAGTQMPIEEFDFERTIYFETAFDRINEVYPTMRSWRGRLLSSRNGSPDALHALRNSIVHFNGNERQRGQYVAAIIEVALPFLEEIFGIVSQHEPMPVSLPHLLKEWIYREVEVARAVLREMRANGQPWRHTL